MAESVKMRLPAITPLETGEEEKLNGPGYRFGKGGSLAAFGGVMLAAMLAFQPPAMAQNTDSTSITQGEFDPDIHELVSEDGEDNDGGDGDEIAREAEFDPDIFEIDESDNATAEETTPADDDGFIVLDEDVILENEYGTDDIAQDDADAIVREETSPAPVENIIVAEEEGFDPDLYEEIVVDESVDENVTIEPAPAETANTAGEETSGFTAIIDSLVSEEETAPAIDIEGNALAEETAEEIETDTGGDVLLAQTSVTDTATDEFPTLPAPTASDAPSLAVAAGTIPKDELDPELRAPVFDAMVNHPNVAEARSLICSAASQYDTARGRLYPQVNFRVTGNSSLTKRIKAGDPNLTRLRAIDAEDKAIDGVFSLTQLLYDWGLTGADKKIALNAKAGNSIAMQIELDRIASEIINLSLVIAEYQARYDLYEQYGRELEPIVAQLEESVSAGVLRIGDLRAIKIIQLDAEIALNLAQRERDQAESQLVRSHGLTFAEASVLLNRFLAGRPDVPPQIDSLFTREVRRLDINIQTADLELKKLKSERFPRLQVGSDFRLFDIDDFDNEYEVSGNFSVNLPVFDGGSNRARRVENRWVARGLENTRANAIRQHSSAVANTIQAINRAREGLRANADKRIEAEARLDETRAREGITVSDPLALARTIQQLTEIRAEEITLSSQVELGLLQGMFFADQLGTILELPYGGPQC